MSKARRERADFPGADRILREREEGPERKRVGLLVDGAPAREGAEILADDGTAIGVVTSGGFSPTLGRAIAMGYVPPAFAMPGTMLQGSGARPPAAGRSRGTALRSPPLLPQTPLKGPEMTTRFTKDHEYIRVEGETGIVGITNYAQEQLGDIVFVELPTIGNEITKGDEVAVVESVKAASEIYSPVSGTVTEVNEALSGEPGLINSDPEQGGWMYKIRIANAAELDDLMDETAYKAHTA